MKIKNLLKILAFTFIAIPIMSVACNLQGSRVAEYAKNKGFRFSSNSEGDASCKISSHNAGGSAASNGEGSCTLELFIGKGLSGPWAFRDFQFSGENYQVVETPSPGESSLYIKVELTPGTDDRSTFFLLTEISIEGDDCDDWQDAFNAPPSVPSDSESKSGDAESDSNDAESEASDSESKPGDAESEPRDAESEPSDSNAN